MPDYPCTLMIFDADLPFDVLAVIRTVPGFFPATRPFAFTLAILLLEEVHLTACGASAGKTAATRLIPSWTPIQRLPLTVTFLAGGLTTVTAHGPEMPFIFA